jgi:hypothetical protein
VTDTANSEDSAPSGRPASTTYRRLF